MRHTLIALATAAALAATSEAPAAGTSLTIYSGDYGAVLQSEATPGGPGYALLDTTVAFDLAQGANRVNLGRLPAALDASSVRLQPLGGAQVLGQRFDFALAGQDELLRRAIGQTVSVEQTVGGSRSTYTGVLMAAGGGLTLQLPDGRLKVLSDYASFELPRLPEGMVTEPTLAWNISAGRAGRQDFALGYATAGLAWQAEYLATLSGAGTACRMDLEGAAMVVNRAGADFGDVALTLVAGQPRRQPVAGPTLDMIQVSGSRAKASYDAAPAAPEPEASGEYHAYRLPGASQLPQGSVQRLPLINPARAVPCERRFETRSPQPGWRPPQPIVDANFNAAQGEQPVIASLRFVNRKAGGLGVPLPAGRVRVFDGADLLGEAALGHTPAEATVDLDLGTVFDLRAERTRLAFQVDRSAREMTETLRVTVSSAKGEPSTVRVMESLPRWSDWEITTSSAPAIKLDAQTAAFDLSVPAGGKAQLTYTVRYRWAPDVTIE